MNLTMNFGQSRIYTNEVPLKLEFILEILNIISTCIKAEMVHQGTSQGNPLTLPEGVRKIWTASWPRTNFKMDTRFIQSLE